MDRVEMQLYTLYKYTITMFHFTHSPFSATACKLASIMALFLVLLVVTLVVGYYLFNKGRKGWKNPPPGPKGIPILGNLLQITDQCETFGNWAKEYGPIYKMQLGNNNAVVISDHRLVKEAFSKAEFSGRFIDPLFDVVGAGVGKPYAVIQNEGPHWEELRRFTLRSLRDFGFGKKSLEDSIMLEVNELLERLGDAKNGVDNMKDRLHFAVVNALWAIIAGKRYKHDDEVLLKITKEVTAFFEYFKDGRSQAIIMLPIIAKLFPELSGFNKIQAGLTKMHAQYSKCVEEKEANSSSEGDDFISVFREESEKVKDPDSPFYGKRGRINLMGLLSDMYIAGTDTTSTTLAWMVLYLSKMPWIQEKVQEEIERVVGNNRQVSLEDRPSMPYTEALIAETMRYSSIVAMGINHKTLEDVEFHGYSIPKGTIVIPNQYFIHRDPKVWGDPLNFRPQRFLTSEGTFKKHEALIPFSIGRRQCIGETLAKDSLFLFATNLFQKFKVEFDPTGPDHGFEAEKGFILSPKPYKVILKDRT